MAVARGEVLAEDAGPGELVDAVPGREGYQVQEVIARGRFTSRVARRGRGSTDTPRGAGLPHGAAYLSLTSGARAVAKAATCRMNSDVPG